MQPRGKSFPGKMKREKSKGPKVRKSPAFQGQLGGPTWLEPRKQGESGREGGQRVRGVDYASLCPKA